LGLSREKQLIKVTAGVLGKGGESKLHYVEQWNNAKARRADRGNERNRDSDGNAFSAIVFNDRLCSWHERSPV
ncbi:hypothetical protein, partial [Enterobacter hormaechei]|uniref:hypothetical protein n=1 Tax=Enterobacter hormaechei TaxID=158836 RepID=UPI001F1AC6E9